jgi:hypothetical protein
MKSPITITDAPVSAVRSTVCIACSEGDHEQALRARERCTCPCHDIAKPSAEVAA